MDYLVKIDLNAFIASFLVCSCCIPAAVLASHRVGLVDRPTGRKRHAASTSLAGGICVFIAFIFAVSVADNSVVSLGLISWLSIVLLVGIIDDYTDISHRIRLFVHALIVLGIAITETSMVSNVGAITGTVDIKFAGFATASLFTIIGVLGAVNAVNMIDGVDGLLASLLVISLIAVLFLTSGSVGTDAELFSHVEIWAMLGACVAFFVVNSRIIFKRGIVFLGDAGSTTLGFLLVYILISYTQGPNPAFSPTLAGWLIGLPLLDASAVIVNRLIEGKPPVVADRSHLHYLLTDRGYSVNRTVLTLCGLHTSMICVAVTIEGMDFRFSNALLFWGFIGLVLIRLVLFRKSFGNGKKETSDELRLSRENPTLNQIIGSSEVGVIDKPSKNISLKDDSSSVK